MRMIVEDAETHANAQVSQDSDSERPTKVVLKSRKHSIFTHIRKKPRLRSLLENQIDKGSLQKTHWRSSTTCRKVWRLYNS